MNLKNLYIYLPSVILLIISFNVINAQQFQNLEKTDSLNIRTSDTYGNQSLVTFISNQNKQIIINDYTEVSKIISSLKLDLYRISPNELLDFLSYETEDVGTYSKIKYKDYKIKDQVKIATINKENYEEGSVIDLPITDNGIYFVRATVGNKYNDLAIINTDIGGVINELEDGYLVWGQRISNGTRLNGGVVETYNLDGSIKLISSVKLDSDGLAKINNEADLVVLKSFDEKIAVIPLNYPQYGYIYGSRYLESSEIYQKHYLFLDKPIYQRGDKVNYKSIVRNDNDANYTIASGSLRVLALDSERDIISNEIKTINSQGFINGEINIPENSPTGYYYIRIIDPNEDYEDGDYTTYATKTFQVEEYRKPEYTLTTNILNEKENNYIVGDQIIFEIEGKYFFGAPLSGQEVDVVIKNISDDLFVFDEKVKLDDYGKALIEFNTKDLVFETNFSGNTYNDRAKYLTFEASFNDDTGNNVLSKESYISVRDSEISIIDNVDNPRILNLGDEYVLDFGTYLNDDRDKLYDSNINIDLEIIREQSIPYYGFSGGSSYIAGYNTVTSVYDSRKISTDDGKISIPFKTDELGTYLFKFLFKDNRNNQIVRNIRKEVVLKQENNTYNNDIDNQWEHDADIDLILDKEEYAPGDTVNIVVTTQQEGRDALLTIERGNTKRYKLINLSEFINRFSIDTLYSDLPNVYLKLVTFAPNGYISKTENISFDKSSKDINVDLVFNSENYGPGQDVNIDIKTTNSEGEGISTDVALFGVDKSIYELARNYRTPIFEFFWQNRFNSTFTSHSLKSIASSGGAEKGGGGDEGARDLFTDVSYWNPSVITDQNGNANVQFKLPDNLTTWSFVAIGANRETEVGENKKDIVVSKPLFVRTVLPNFLRQGDIFEMSSYVHNYTGEDQYLDAYCSVEDKVVDNKKYEIKNAKQSKDLWDYGTIDLDKEDLKVYCEVGNENFADSIEKTIPLYDFGFYERDVQVGIGSKEFTVNLPGDKSIKENKINLSLSSSITGTITEAAEYLLDYPYGCVEQTTSRLVPAIVIKENPDIYEGLVDQDIDSIIQTGVDQLEKYVSYDGVRWWSYGEVNPYITSYVSEYLVRAENLGYDVKNSKIDNLKNWAIRRYKEAEFSEKVAAAYALSFLDPNGYYPVKGDYNSLTPDILSMAVINNYKEGIKDRYSNGLDVLINKKQENNGNIWWSTGLRNFFGTQDSSTAMVLNALIEVGDDSYTDQVVRFITANRNGSYWSNTFATAQMINALTKYVRENGLEISDTQYNIIVNDDLYEEGELNRDSYQKEFDLSQLELRNGDKVRVEFNGNAQIYSTLLSESFVDDKNVKESDNGLKVTREYVGDFIPGEIIEINIKVENIPDVALRQMVVKDYLPAGLVPINLNLDNEQSVKNNYSNFSHYDVTKDGVIFAYDNVYGTDQNSDTIISSYKARVVSRGQYYAPPAEASLMYLPEIYGRSAVDMVDIDYGGGAISSVIAESIFTLLMSVAGFVIILGIIALILGRKVNDTDNKEKQNI